MSSDPTLRPVKTELVDLEHTVEQFDVGDLVSAQPRSAEAADTYLVRTRRERGGADFILTFVDLPSLPTSSYVTLLDRCAEAGMPVAALVRTRKNLPYVTTRASPAFLAPRLPGRNVYNPTHEQVQAVGRIAARLHVASAAIEYLMPDFPKTLSWLREQEQRQQGQLAFDAADLIHEATERLTSVLRRTDVGELPTGVIHTALHRDHVLFNERGLSGLLGLDNAAQGALLYDLAVAANDWCTDSAGAVDGERLLALLKGYQEVRPLTKPELWFLPSFGLYAGLTTWLSRLSAKEEHDKRFSNPRELQAIVQQQMGRALYLDERLLS